MAKAKMQMFDSLAQMRHFEKMVKEKKFPLSEFERLKHNTPKGTPERKSQGIKK